MAEPDAAETGVGLTTAGQPGQQQPTSNSSTTTGTTGTDSTVAATAAATATPCSSTTTTATYTTANTTAASSVGASSTGATPSSATGQSQLQDPSSSTFADEPTDPHRQKVDDPAQATPGNPPDSHPQDPSASEPPTPLLRLADPSPASLSHHHQPVVSPQSTTASPDPVPDRDNSPSAPETAVAPPDESHGDATPARHFSAIAAQLDPLSPVSPTTTTTTKTAAAAAAAAPAPAAATTTHDPAGLGLVTSDPSPPAAASPVRDSPRPSPTDPRDSSAGSNVDSLPSSSSATDAFSPSQRRAPASRSSLGVSTSDGPPPSLRTQRAQGGADGSSPTTVTTPETLSPRDSIQSQRDLFLLKSVSQPSPSDERRASAQRPPVSYRPPANASNAQGPSHHSSPVRVPPIRSFRSSGSRKSLTLDMNYQPRPYDTADEPADPSYDRTLRALEGRQVQDMLQMTPPTSAGHEGFDPDDGGDVFLKIAREEGAQRSANGAPPADTQSTVSRVYRSHRRPLSTNVASYRPRSPPNIGRRLSDQRDTTRSRVIDDNASEVTRPTTLRGFSRDHHKAASTHPAEMTSSRAAGGGLRPSPLTPRALAYQDPGSDNPIPPRRRSSATEHNITPPVRNSIYRSSGPGSGQGKSYNSSPLVRSFDLPHHHHHQQSEGVGAGRLEGTESTVSTTAPSTMWDELDDLKSRIHRLELTGKLPPTSGAAVSRLSDDRPATATTTVTTMSSSPKRSGAAATQNTETSTTSSQKEAYPILHSALSKSKPFLHQDIFRALEAAANDAMALASMMGQPGQPGPISSAASAIGGPGTPVSDRQLRRKADSVCRSLTELCVALGEDSAHGRQTQPSHAQKSSSGQSQGHHQVQHPPSTQSDDPTTPTTHKAASGLQSRRPSLSSTQALSKPNTSPNRSMSKFEERRNTILNGSALPSPRAPGSTPATPGDPAANRRSSLIVSRTRRAVTEEPEESSGRKSSLLRTRRAGTEEPEESRPTTMLRSHRGAGDEDDEEARLRAPSRAYTEVSTARGAPRDYTEVATSARGPTREYAPQPQAASHNPDPNTPSALPRRRFVSSHAAGTRLGLPPSSSASALPTRRPVPTTEREPASASERFGNEERPQRYTSIGSIPLSRTGTLSTRRYSRDTTVTNRSNAAAPAGAYR